MTTKLLSSYTVMIIAYLTLFFSTIVPLTGDLKTFDVIFLPSIIVISLFSDISLSKISSLKACLILLTIYIITVSTLKATLFLNDLFLTYAIALRSILPIALPSLLFGRLGNKGKKNDIVSINSLSISLSLFWVYVSISGLYGFLTGNNILVGFPFTEGGVDRHVLGPSLAIAIIGTTYLLSSNKSFSILNLSKSVKKYRFSEEKILASLSKLLAFLSVPFMTLAMLATGSRGSLLILGSYLIFHFSLLGFRKSTSIQNFFKRKSFLIFIAFLAIFTIILVSWLINSGSLDLIQDYSSRVFNVLGILDGTDASRSDRIDYVLNQLTKPDVLVFGYQEPSRLVDSGIFFYIANFGILSLLIFFLAWYFFSKRLYSNQAKAIAFSMLMLHALASETMNIPRYLILSVMMIALLDRYERLSTLKNLVRPQE